MKIELNLNEVSVGTIRALVNDKIINLGALTLEQKIEYFDCYMGDVIDSEDLSKNDKIKIVNNVLTTNRTSVRENDYKFVVDNCTDEAIQKFKDVLVHYYSHTAYYSTKDEYEKMFEQIEEMELVFNSIQKKQIKTNFWKYVERCNTYATATHIYPENTPEWCVNLYLGDYDNIHRRIALHKATGWKHYNPNNPDNRVQVRAAYADFAGTKKGQAIHDNAYSLRKRAVKEHNLKLVSKKG